MTVNSIDLIPLHVQWLRCFLHDHSKSFGGVLTQQNPTRDKFVTLLANSTDKQVANMWSHFPLHPSVRSSIYLNIFSFAWPYFFICANKTNGIPFHSIRFISFHFTFSLAWTFFLRFLYAKAGPFVFLLHSFSFSSFHFARFFFLQFHSCFS